MNGIWEKFAKYVGVQGVLAMAMTGALIYWVSSGITVPDIVYTLLGASYGFYFAKNGNHLIQAARGG